MAIQEPKINFSSRVSPETPKIDVMPVKKRKDPQIQSCNWVFTINNYTTEDCDALALLVHNPKPFKKSASLVKAIAVAEEIAPTTGTPHLQGYLQCSKKGISLIKLHRR